MGSNHRPSGNPRRSVHLSYTAYHLCVVRTQAHAGHHPCLRYFNIFAHGDIANLTPSVSSVCVRLLPSAQFGIILSHSSLGLTLLPIPLRNLSRRSAGFGNYLVSSGCTYGLDTVSFHSVRFEVCFAAVSAQWFTRIRLRSSWLPISCQ